MLALPFPNQALFIFPINSSPGLPMRLEVHTQTEQNRRYLCWRSRADPDPRWDRLRVLERRWRGQPARVPPSLHLNPHLPANCILTGLYESPAPHHVTFLSLLLRSGTAQAHSIGSSRRAFKSTAPCQSTRACFRSCAHLLGWHLWFLCTYGCQFPLGLKLPALPRRLTWVMHMCNFTKCCPISSLWRLNLFTSSSFSGFVSTFHPLVPLG